MGWPEIEVTEDATQKIAKVCSVLNCICVLPSIIVLSVGVYIQLAVKDKINLVEGFDGTVLPIFMIVVGFLGTFISAAGGKICWANCNPQKRVIWGKYLFPYVITQVVLFISVFVSAIVCFAHISMLEESFQKGILSAMNAYKKDKTKKAELDVLQIEYNCCGSESYLDWFQIDWVHEDYQPKSKKKAINAMVQQNGKYLNDDVPFSCCNPNNLRPCIHHHVHDNDLHFNYDYRSRLTINEAGCRSALMKFYGDQLLTDVGILVLFISFLQLAALILVRLLETSVTSSLENDDPKEPYIGYFLPCGERAMAAVKTAKKEITKYHKQGSDSSPTKQPLLTGNEGDVEDEIDTDNISVTDSFDSVHEPVPEKGNEVGDYEQPIQKPTTSSDHVYASLHSVQRLHSSQNVPPRQAATYVNEIME